MAAERTTAEILEALSPRRVSCGVRQTPSASARPWLRRRRKSPWLFGLQYRLIWSHNFLPDLCEGASP